MAKNPILGPKKNPLRPEMIKVQTQADFQASINFDVLIIFREPKLEKKYEKNGNLLNKNCSRGQEEEFFYFW